MIAWSNSKLKFTSGIGALCTAALLADISHQRIPVWVAIAMAMLPLLIFVFIKPGEIRRSIVLPCQIFAALWYILMAVTLSVLFFTMTEKTRGWPIFHRIVYRMHSLRHHLAETVMAAERPVDFMFQPNKSLQAK